MQAVPLLSFLVCLVFARPTTESQDGDCNSQCDEIDEDSKPEAPEVDGNGHYNGFSLISRDTEQELFSYLANSGDHFCGSILLSPKFALTTSKCVSKKKSEGKITLFSLFRNPRDMFVRVVNVSESRVGKNYNIEKVIKKEQLALLRLKDSIPEISRMKIAANITADPKECVMAVTIEYSGLENGPVQPMQFLDKDECLELFKKKQKFCARSVETRWRQKGRIDEGCPLLCKNSEEPVLFGLQLDADEDSNIDAFVDVRKYKPWIEKILQQ